MVQHTLIYVETDHDLKRTEIKKSCHIYFWGPDERKKKTENASTIDHLVIKSTQHTIK